MSNNILHNEQTMSFDLRKFGSSDREEVFGFLKAMSDLRENVEQWVNIDKKLVLIEIDREHPYMQHVTPLNKTYAEWNPELEELQFIVGGYIQFVSHGLKGYQFMCNEEGSLINLPHNMFMNLFLAYFTEMEVEQLQDIAGTCILGLSEAFEEAKE